MRMEYLEVKNRKLSDFVRDIERCNAKILDADFNICDRFFNSILSGNNYLFSSVVNHEGDVYINNAIKDLGLIYNEIKKHIKKNDLNNDKIDIVLNNIKKVESRLRKMTKFIKENPDNQ